MEWGGMRHHFTIHQGTSCPSYCSATIKGCWLRKQLGARSGVCRAYWMGAENRERPLKQCYTIYMAGLPGMSSQKGASIHVKWGMMDYREEEVGVCNPADGAEGPKRLPMLFTAQPPPRVTARKHFLNSSDTLRLPTTAVRCFLHCFHSRRAVLRTSFYNFKRLRRAKS